MHVQDEKLFFWHTAFGEQHRERRTDLANSAQVWQTAHRFGKQRTGLANSAQVWQTAHIF